MGNEKSNYETYKELIGKYKFKIGRPSEINMDDFIIDVSHNGNKLAKLLDLTERLGFSFDDVYQEYLNKNKINYERLKNGY